MSTDRLKYGQLPIKITIKGKWWWNWFSHARHYLYSSSR